MSACLFINPVSCKDVPGGNFGTPVPFLFWDIVHPTTEAHKALADYLYDELSR
jgi:phospholipase/lecithinase/hemolysin